MQRWMWKNSSAMQPWLNFIVSWQYLLANKIVPQTHPTSPNSSLIKKSATPKSPVSSHFWPNTGRIPYLFFPNFFMSLGTLNDRLGTILLMYSNVSVNVWVKKVVSRKKRSQHPPNPWHLSTHPPFSKIRDQKKSCQEFSPKSCQKRIKTE